MSLTTLMSNLSELLALPELNSSLLNEAQTYGFISALAIAPYPLSPEHWLAYLWGETEQAPFSDATQMQAYLDALVTLWNQTRQQLLEGTWSWADFCLLDEEEGVNLACRDFCEGALQGWQLVRDDWEELIPIDSQDNALLGGVLLSLSLLYDPETTLASLDVAGIHGLAEINEIYDAIPKMFCGLTQRAQAMIDSEES